MCGIAGIWHNYQIRETDIVDCRKLTDSLVNRGPDYQGVSKICDHLTLGHTRLSIIDTSESGRQPMKYLDRYYIVFNGEIYNYVELKEELSARGYKFRSETDTEVILASYDYWGIDALDRFNGMWAFAIYDEIEKRLILSRDRYGIKPLYYVQSNDKITFASQIKSLENVMNHTEYNPNILNKILDGKLDYNAYEETYIKGVKSVPSGHNIIIEESRIEKQKWYTLFCPDISTSEQEQIQEFKSLFFDSLKLRLRSDVDIATCLSGGLDSSSIVASLAYLEKSNPNEFEHYSHRSYNASFPGIYLDEYDDAHSLTETIGSELKSVIVNTPAPDELEKAARSMDGPMHALAFYPIWKLYKSISSDNIKVTLDGQGPDELLGGYLSRRLSVKALESAIGNKDLKRVVDIFNTVKELGVFAKLEQKPLPFFIQEFRRIVGGLRNGEIEWEKLSSSFNRYMNHQFFCDPLPTILQQYDRCSMAHGVECRMPFMDYRLVEYSMQLPDNLKFGGTYTKRVIREAMSGIVPDQTRLKRKKIGFNAPFTQWMQNELKEWTLDQLKSKAFQESPYFDGKKNSHEMESSINNREVTWDQAWKIWPKLHLSLIQ